MNPQFIWELVGYFASTLVLISLIMTNIRKLRIINAIGSFIFSVYAIAIHSYPTAIMNAVLVGVNVYYLVKLMKTEVAFSFIEVHCEDSTIQHFLKTFEQDILTYFPDYQSQTVTKAFAIYQDSSFAGITFGNEREDGALELCLDYSTPQYRDHSVGSFMYNQLAKSGYKKLIYAGNNPKHTEYLLKMGFHKEKEVYVKSLSMPQ